MVPLPRVQIPGYAEAVKRERELRDTAFLGGNELVAGVECRPFSLRHLAYLEAARNGFVVPCRFFDEEEMLAHALQVLWICRKGFRAPDSPRIGRLGLWRMTAAQQLFVVRVLWNHSGADVVKAVEDWLRDAFMDAPTGSADAITTTSYTATQAMFLDKFAEAGLPFTYDEVMDMPMRRLWQHWRLAVRRVNDVKLTNPSDEVAVAHLAGR